MAIVAKNTGEARELAPEGGYLAACVGVIDLGTQPGGQFGPSHKLALMFELHKKKGPVRGKDDKPLVITQFVPLSFGISTSGQKAKLRQAVEGILGKTFTDQEAKAGYDVTQLIEKGCRVKVVHEKSKDGQKTYDGIESYMPLDEDDPDLRIETNSVVYELDPESPVPEEVPAWLAKMIHKSAEFVKVHGQPAADKTEAKGKPVKAATNGKTARRKPDDDDDDDEDDIPY
jgi:hypothetical protein